MIATFNELRCKNPDCGNIVTQLRGHRRRQYCSDTCKQTAYRLRKEQAPATHGVTIVDDCTQARIAELEQELALAREGREQVQERFRQYVRQTNEKLGDQAGELAALRKELQGRQAHVEEMERKEDADAILSISVLEHKVTTLEQELAAAHALIDEYIHRKRNPAGYKDIVQKRFWQLGEEKGWPALSISVPLQAGERAYRVFGLAASNELLEWASVALRNRDIAVV